MNRFFSLPGDVSRQLAPWELERRGMAIKPYFELYEAFSFSSDILGGVLTIPKGRISDLASIPQFAWSIFMRPDDPRIELGAWVHDELYGAKGRVPVAITSKGIFLDVVISRDQADRILAFECMPDLGASKFQQHAVYQSLKYFGDRWH